jgi:hypothetical protein
MVGLNDRFWSNIFPWIDCSSAIDEFYGMSNGPNGHRFCVSGIIYGIWINLVPPLFYFCA